MKPVHQNRFGKIEGNCFEACIASLLECSIKEIPILNDNHSEFNHVTKPWSKKLVDFLDIKGLCFVEMTFTGGKEIGYWLFHSGYSIITGKSPREGNILHCVVAYQGKMVHDPHPDNTGLEDIQMIGFLCLKCDTTKS